MTIIELDHIKNIVSELDVVEAMKQGFIQYSEGNTVVPPVGELLFEQPPGDVHIKYGYIKNEPYYVIKIASGFYENSKLGLPSSNGMMLLYSQRTGAPVAILLDEGHLTDIRTAAAGALAAIYFAPKKIEGIGILGTGIQARLQLKYLQKYMSCENVWLWGRTLENAHKFIKEFEDSLTIKLAASPSEIAHNCNLIVTTTPSKQPLLLAKDIKAGTHITAVGADTSDKQELESAILARATIVVSDSIAQSKSRGEIYQARKSRDFSNNKIVELGKAIQDNNLRRSSDSQISVVDLTGVAVQDIMITSAVYNSYMELNK